MMMGMIFGGLKLFLAVWKDKIPKKKEEERGASISYQQEQAHLLDRTKRHSGENICEVQGRQRMNNAFVAVCFLLQSLALCVYHCCCCV